ncbi:hypothetical protein LOC68_05070 [Blastopirellula sp. JC732]|uniref:Uncharacterized protein n=1 Tax=Blastopirellula sediminis TaxID=2894196 RepID=A0A9X1MKT4_9BACT|nr:hypothetical protein [Blastopirellula sediminis]MCC9609466.1 hypothetical protein [Blastopirellula sediminis]MCC9627757.1 hypothetical protein [Blastopirellula sediminis]
MFVRNLQLVLFGFAALLVIGCGERKIVHDPNKPSDYGRLTLTRQVNHPELSQLVSPIVDEGKSPLGLEEELAADQDPPNNGVAALMKIYPGPLADQIIDSTNAWLPNKEFQFAPLTLEKIHAYVVRHREKVDRGRAALQMPQWKYFWQPTEGYMADVHFVECTRAAARLEILSAAVALADQDLDAASIHIAFALELASRLGQVNLVYARRTAAELRAEAFPAIAALAQQPNVTRDELSTIAKTLASHVAAWPNDADAWIADRACGLHQYELIRDGQFLSTVPRDEYQQLKAENELEALTRAVARNLNSDEVVYLKQMRALIEGCRLPFYQRAELLSQLHSQLAALEGTNDYPTVAARWLLVDVDKQQRIAARDQALSTAWNLALGLALGEEPVPAPPINVLTGAPYQIRIEPTRVVVAAVDGGGEDEIIQLPRLGKPANN